MPKKVKDRKMRRRRKLTLTKTGATTFFKAIGFGFVYGVPVAKKVSVTKTVSFVTAMSTATEFIGDINVDFGALTLAGDGGQPKSTGTITGGSASGYTLSGGFVTPTNNGSADAGTIEFSDSTTWTMSLISDAYSARGWTEFARLIETTGMVYGQTVLLRAGTIDRVSNVLRPKAITGSFVAHSDLDPANYQGKDVTSGTYVTIKPHAGDTVVFLSSVSARSSLFLDNSAGTGVGFRFTGLTFQKAIDGGETPNVWALSLGSSGVGVEHITVDNCLIETTGFTFAVDQDLYSGLQAFGDNVVVMDNTFKFNSSSVGLTGEDNVVVGNTSTDNWGDWCGVTGPCTNYLHAWNLVYLKDGLDTTPPSHTDFCQIVGPSVSTSNINYIGNRFFQGKVFQGTVMGQGFFDDNMATASVRLVGYLIAGNIAGIDTARATTQAQVDGLDVYHNTFWNEIARLNFATGIFTRNISWPAADPLTDVVVRNNIAHQISFTDATSPVDENNDTSLDASDIDTYTTLFADPAGGAGLTPANIETKMAPKASGPADVADHIPIVGCLPVSGRTAMVDFSARTVDFPFQEAAFTPDMPILTDVALSTAVTATDQITGVSATGAECWITGGNSPTMEIRESDDSTVVIGSVPVGEHHIVYANQHVHINDTSSSSNSTQFDVVLNIGIKSDTFSHTTVA